MQISNISFLYLHYIQIRQKSNVFLLFFYCTFNLYLENMLFFHPNYNILKCPQTLDFTGFSGTLQVITIWLTQWGSKSLGDQGYSPIEILRYYYGDDMYINTAEAISGIPSSWPGYTLKIGSSGNKVQQMQEQLNVIAGAYPAIPKITADGIYGPATAEAVRVFQKVFGLPQTGEVDYTTWYKISEIYVGVSRIAELN